MFNEYNKKYDYPGEQIKADHRNGRIRKSKNEYLDDTKNSELLAHSRSLTLQNKRATGLSVLTNPSFNNLSSGQSANHPCSIAG